MRYFVIVLALAINVALVKQGVSGQAGRSADGDGSGNPSAPGAGYTYVINATRTENVIAPGYPVAYMYYQVSPIQNLTYYRSVGPTNPLMIEGYISNGNTVYFENDEERLLNSCAKLPNGTWEFVLIEVVRKSVLLGGDCSVDKGSYTIRENVDPITVTLPEMIECGETALIFNAFVVSGQNNWTWGFQLHFSLEIDGECNEL